MGYKIKQMMPCNENLFAKYKDDDGSIEKIKVLGYALVEYENGETFIETFSIVDGYIDIDNSENYDNFNGIELVIV